MIPAKLTVRQRVTAALVTLVWNLYCAALHARRTAGHAALHKATQAVRSAELATMHAADMEERARADLRNMIDYIDTVKSG